MFRNPDANMRLTDCSLLSLAEYASNLAIENPIKVKSRQPMIIGNSENEMVEKNDSESWLALIAMSTKIATLVKGFRQGVT